MFGVTYIPPDSIDTIYVDHGNSVEDLAARYPEFLLYLYRDYNLPLATWGNSQIDGLLVQCPLHYPAHIVDEHFTFLNLKQVNFIRNPRNSIFN